MKTKQITINPPHNGCKNAGETFKHKGFECPSCSGRGRVVLGKGYHGSLKGETIESDCDRCAGTGLLCADVVIRWSPDKQ